MGLMTLLYDFNTNKFGGLPLPPDAELGFYFDANRGTYTNQYGGLDLIEGPAFGERLTRWDGYPKGVYAAPLSDSTSPSLERLDTDTLSEATTSTSTTIT